MELEPEGILPREATLQTGRDEVVARVEALLEEERYEDALEVIATARAEGSGNVLDLTFLAGDAYLALGRAPAAETQFREVLRMDPDCPSSRCWLAMALFLQWRFAEAEAAVAAAMEVPGALADAFVIHGALLERHGRYDEAERAFATANEIAPDKHPLPVRMTRAEFDREVRQAARKLPRQFRQALDRVPVVVEDIPSAELKDLGDGEDLAPDLLGLFDGVPLPETEGLDVGAWKPNRIFLFQRNLERVAVDSEDLVEQIRITLWHELGHYLGFEEDDMDDLGLA